MVMIVYRRYGRYADDTVSRRFGRLRVRRGRLV